MEERHELMLSMIRDRIENKDKYEREYFEKYSKWKDTRQKGSKYSIHGMKPSKRRQIDGCKYKEDVNILTILSRHPYLEFKNFGYAIEPFDMHEFERLPNSDSQKVYAEAQSILTAEAKALGTLVKS